MTPKQMARLGVFQIQEAILSVLAQEPEGLEPDRISATLGVPDCLIVQGVLAKLQREGYVLSGDLENRPHFAGCARLRKTTCFYKKGEESQWVKSTQKTPDLQLTSMSIEAHKAAQKNLKSPRDQSKYLKEKRSPWNH